MFFFYLFVAHPVVRRHLKGAVTFRLKVDLKIVLIFSELASCHKIVLNPKIVLR